MFFKENDQFGFGLVGVLIVLVVLTVVAVSGWVVHKHQQKTISSANTISTSKYTTQTQDQNKKNKDTTQYVTIKEWGVRAPYSGSLTLTYTISSDGKSAVFSSNQLTTASSACAGRGGAILRWASIDTVSELPANANAPTAEQYFASQPASSYAHIGDYYYSFKHDPAACGNLNSNSAARLYAQTNDDVQGLVPKLQADLTN